MENTRLHCFILLLLPLVSLLSAEISEARRRVSVEDDLDDVVDNEEDEAWIQWGKKRVSSDQSLHQPPDFDNLTPLQIQEEMMRRHTGPSLGFVKLQLGVRRSTDDVPEIAMRWSKVLRTGTIEAKFMAVDLNTIMFTIEKGQELEELKEFILSQPEAYEMKIGEQLYRRPGDPPLDEVVEKLYRERSAVGRERSTVDSHVDPVNSHQHMKDEL